MKQINTKAVSRPYFRQYAVPLRQQRLNEGLLTKIAGVVAIFAVTLASFTSFAQADPEPKITICHATSSETNPYESITVSANATSGHFEDNGTDKAGHELDFIINEPDAVCPTTGEITVTKVVVGGSNVVADFPLTITNNVTGTEIDLTSGVSATVTAGFFYTVSEVNQPGYTASFSGDCTSSGVIGLEGGDSQDCTLTNTFEGSSDQGNVTVTKVVTNDSGGTAVVADFALTVGSEPVVSGVAESFDPGTYTVGETGPSGYTTTFSGDCDNQGQITVVAGQNYNCTLTNDDNQAQLTVTKVVVNDGGGTLTVSDFPLFVSGVSVTSGVAASFNAGSYVVTETTQPNYSGAFSGDCNASGQITLALGVTAACTITNTFRTPSPNDLDVAVDKTVSDSAPDENQTITYTLTVTNAGPALATDVVLTDVIPDGVIYISDNGGTATEFDDATNTLTWTIGVVGGDNPTIPLVITVQVDNDTAGDTITNTATVPVDANDVNPGNNSDSAIITVNTSGGGGGGGSTLSNSVSGVKYNDLNRNGNQDSGENGLAGWVIYLDENNNNVFDSGEESDTTNSDGEYSITGVSSGDYQVREVAQDGWTQFEPGSSNGLEYDITMTRTSDFDGLDFGNAQGLVLGESTQVPSINVPAAGGTNEGRVLGESTSLPRTGGGLSIMILLASLVSLAVLGFLEPTPSRK